MKIREIGNIENHEGKIKKVKTSTRNELIKATKSRSHVVVRKI